MTEKNPHISPHWPAKQHPKVDIFHNGKYKFSSTAYENSKKAKLGAAHHLKVDPKEIKVSLGEGVEENTQTDLISEDHKVGDKVLFTRHTGQKHKATVTHKHDDGSYSVRVYVNKDYDNNWRAEHHQLKKLSESSELAKAYIKHLDKEIAKGQATIAGKKVKVNKPGHVLHGQSVTVSDSKSSHFRKVKDKDGKEHDLHINDLNEGNTFPVGTRVKAHNPLNKEIHGVSGKVVAHSKDNHGHAVKFDKKVKHDGISSTYHMLPITHLVMEDETAEVAPVIVEAEEGHHGYIAFSHHGKQAEIHAKTKYEAHQKAVALFKPPKSKAHMVHVHLAQKADGTEVVHKAVD